MFFYKQAFFVQKYIIPKVLKVKSERTTPEQSPNPAAVIQFEALCPFPNGIQSF